MTTGYGLLSGRRCHHFSLLQERLGEFGYSYGDFDAHDGLWEMAMVTAHDPLIRMALVPRVLEARGLDVTPSMIKRLKDAGDSRTVAILEIILREEVGHVEIGSRWFRYCCEQAGLPAEETFRKHLRTYYRRRSKGHLTKSPVLPLGFSVAELAKIRDLEKEAD